MQRFEKNLVNHTRWFTVEYRLSVMEVQDFSLDRVFKKAAALLQETGRAVCPFAVGQAGAARSVDANTPSVLMCVSRQMFDLRMSQRTNRWQTPTSH